MKKGKFWINIYKSLYVKWPYRNEVDFAKFIPVVFGKDGRSSLKDMEVGEIQTFGFIIDRDLNTYRIDILRKDKDTFLITFYYPNDERFLEITADMEIEDENEGLIVLRGDGETQIGTYRVKIRCRIGCYLWTFNPYIECEIEIS